MPLKMLGVGRVNCACCDVSCRTVVAKRHARQERLRAKIISVLIASAFFELLESADAASREFQ